MRRTDREVSGLENILAILDKCEILRLGMCYNNKPYIVPMNFGYESADGKVFIYLHCAPEGKKTDIISKNNSVCFEADCAYKTVKADEACKWSAEYQSVIGEGIITVLSGEEQKINALDIIMKRYGSEQKPRYNPKALSAAAVLRIAVTSMTGKQKMKG